VLGVAFTSGDVLALRRFPLTSCGPAYTSVWHRSPAGRWTLFTDVADHGCARYFGPTVDDVVVAPIRIEWTGPRSMSIAIDGGRRLNWSMLMRSTAMTRAFSRLASYLEPIHARHSGLVVTLAAVGRVLLRTGPLRLKGLTPGGAVFIVRPWALWVVRSSRACIAGRDSGPNCPLGDTLTLGDCQIPRRALFAASHLRILRP
jgi:hypothetical protein